MAGRTGPAPVRRYWADFQLISSCSADVCGEFTSKWISPISRSSLRDLRATTLAKFGDLTRSFR